MKQEIVAYPIILTEYNDEAGHYYVVTSPNLQGLVTDGKSITEALSNAKDAIATLLDGLNYPKVQDPRRWELNKQQQTSWVTVNLTKWRNKHEKTCGEIFRCLNL
jgi:predicted RNase H-like HicB family nuclease